MSQPPSAKLMNNTKWRLFFHTIDTLDAHVIGALKCLDDEQLYHITVSGYSEIIFKDQAIDFSCGLIYFKAIEWLYIPATITTPRYNREEVLSPLIDAQPVNELAEKLLIQKNFPLAIANDGSLTLSGYYPTTATFTLPLKPDNHDTDGHNETHDDSGK